MLSQKTETFSDSISLVIEGQQDTSKSFSGPTAKEDLTRKDGGMMSRVEAWLQQERFSGITNAGLLSSSAFALVLLLIFGRAYLRRNDVFYFEGKKFKVVGLAKLNDSGRNLFTPVYEESK